MGIISTVLLSVAGCFFYSYYNHIHSGIQNGNLNIHTVPVYDFLMYLFDLNLILGLLVIILVFAILKLSKANVSFF